MSYNAIRFFATNKKLKRVLRHQTKYILPAPVMFDRVPQHDIANFISYANRFGLLTLASIGSMASSFPEALRQRDAYKELHMECKKKLELVELDLTLSRVRIRQLEEKILKQKRKHKINRTKRR